MSVGWRSKEKDAFDVTSFTIKYNRDNEKIEFLPFDGEAFGSQSGYYLIDADWEYQSDLDYWLPKDAGGADVSATSGIDYNGFRNITIKQWTDDESLRV